MQGVSLFIAIIGSICAFGLKPSKALCAFVIFLMWYPQSLTLPIGAIDFTTARIIVLPLLANLVFRAKALRTFKWSWLDFWFMAHLAGIAIAATRNAELSLVLVRQGGMFFDVGLTYFAARLALKSREDLIVFIKGMAWAGVPLAIAGLYESKTGHNPFGFMYEHFSFGLSRTGDPNDIRMGFYRARATFGNAIPFGLAFAAIVPLCLGLWKCKTWPTSKVFVISAILTGGLMSSLSSAPLFSLVMTLGMILCYPFRRFWPVLLIGFFVCMLFVEVFSNRHFYHVLTRFALNSKTAHYRIALIDEAFGGGMDRHWLFGYGYVGVDPMADNKNFTWEHKDLTNIYIAKLARFGLVGLIPFLFVNVLFYRRLIQASLRTRRSDEKWLFWCIGSAMVGLNIAMMTVTALAQFDVLFHMLIAVCENTRAIAASGANTAAQQSRAPERAQKPDKDRVRVGFPRPLRRKPRKRRPMRPQSASVNAPANYRR